MVLDRLAASGADFLVFNQREFAECQLDFEVSGGLVTGTFRLREQGSAARPFSKACSRA